MKRVYSARSDRILSNDPLIVRRYGAFTRANHWLTALCMLVLVLTDFAFFAPSLFFLTGLFGGGQTARWLHPIVGLVMAASFVVLLVQLVRLNIPNRDDVDWTMQIGDLLGGNENVMPPLGKYNAGQKLVFWGMAGLLAVMLFTGVMIWEEMVPLWQDRFPTLAGIPARRIAVALHALSAVLMVLLLILHVYAAIWTRGTFSAMLKGTVTGGWAYQHHRKWLRELAGRAGDSKQD
jgi:formate dehydrogenase subunit gamma